LDSTAIIIVTAIVCITILEIVNMLTMKIDGSILSAIVSAIVYIVTRVYYTRKKKEESEVRK
jgi:O-antigen/teichoic acid export membrane protein